jgi:hypothetical protein
MFVGDPPELILDSIRRWRYAELPALRDIGSVAR